MPEENRGKKIRDFLKIRENGKRIFIDPSKPVWFAVNDKGADIVEGLLRGADYLEDAEALEFIKQLHSQELVDKAVLDVQKYSGRSGLIKHDILDELWLHVTNVCNLTCKHCLVSAVMKNDGSYREMTTEEIYVLVEEARSLGARRFYLSGGEPFLREDIFDLIERVTQKDQLVILTNGSLIKRNRKSLDGLRNKNRILFQVSLEADCEEIHDNLRSKGGFKVAIEGIKTLIDIGMTPVAAMTITKINISRLCDVNRLLQDLGVRFQHLLWLHQRGRAAGNRQLSIDPKEIAMKLEELQDVSSGTGVAVTVQKAACARVSGRRSIKNDLCHAGCGTLAIGPDGEAYPCGALVGEEALKCGSVVDEGLTAIWKDSKVLKDIRNASLTDTQKCASCSYRFYCGGGCISYKYFNNGHISGIDPYCDTYKVLYENALLNTVRERCKDIKPVKDRPVIYAASCPPAELPPGQRLDVRSFHCACVLTTNDECKKDCS